MRTIHLPRLQSIHLEGDQHAVIETPEHEVVDIEGCSPDEVQAKLDDFTAWAS